MVNSSATSSEEEQIAPELRNSPLSRENLISFTIVSSQYTYLDLSILQEVSDNAKSRLLEPIGNIPPAEAEANFYATMERSDMAA